MIRQPKLRLVIFMLAIVATVVACSSSSTKSSSTGTATSAASGTSTSGKANGTPITVGIICTCSGGIAGSGGDDGPDVYQAWADSVDASGGINGHPVKVSVKNDGGVPSVSASDAQTLISNHVDAILDLSDLDQTWAADVKSAGVPVIGAEVSEAPFYTNSDFYPVGQTNNSTIPAIVATAKAAGAKNIANVYCAEAAVCAEWLSSFEQAGKDLGVPDVYNEALSGTAPNYIAQCLAAKQLNVGAVFLGESYNVVERFGKDCSQQGYVPMYLQNGQGYDSSETTSPGTNVDTLLVFPDLPLYAATPAIQTMYDAVDKYYPGIRTNSDWTVATAWAWPAGLLLGDAVKAGGLGASDTPSAAEIVKGLESLKGDTVDGWTPPLTFPAGQPHPIDCWFTGLLKNGVQSLSNGGKPTCSNVS